MVFFANSNDIIVVDIEVTEKIDYRYLKSFVLSNLKLKNISLENSDKLYVNYLEYAKEYQVFVVNSQFSFFDFEVFYTYYENIDFEGFELLICSNFFVIFKDKRFFYYQKINQDLNQDDFVKFLNKKFNINISSIKIVSKDEFEKLKKDFINKNQINTKYINKEGLKYIDLKANFSFYIYIFYLLSVLFFGYYFYNTYFNIVEKKEEPIDFEAIKSKIAFNSFEDKFYVISKNIDKNRLVLNSFDYRHGTGKIVVSSSNKQNIDKFLESCENVISSSTHFIEESKIFEATIDVGKL
ncbi:hypothetical protein CJ671_09120 [Aliarcobacter cryaerophilus]|uniref:Uncharacterized protein n=1 Tax=Aliarcobacter cryaerophilus TaxID=28198 RepID=A0A2S9SP45_9BACT|nr:hypothetical protein [Aliarcobacter cryaerophilus]PRM88289.1 hypothetical protein CJ671_09120 [Aliarcobacter cryaerophilus]